MDVTFWPVVGPRVENGLPLRWPAKSKVKNSFPAACRLRSEQEIKAVLARRDLFRGQRLIFYRGPLPSGVFPAPTTNDTPEHRFCLVVSKECGNSPRRNRIRRVLREIIRCNRYRIPAGFDYIIRAIAQALPEGKLTEETFRGDFDHYFGWN